MAAASKSPTTRPPAKAAGPLDAEELDFTRTSAARRALVWQTLERLEAHLAQHASF